MKLSDHLLEWLPWIPDVAKFSVQSVIAFVYIFNSNSLEIVPIIMKPMAY